MCIFKPHIVSGNFGPGVLLQPTVLEFDKTPQQIVAEARAQFETLVRLYYLRHSFPYFDPLMVHFLSVFSFSSIDDLSQTNTDPERAEATYSSIVLSAKGIRD